MDKLWETPALLQSYAFKSKIETGVAIEKLARAICVKSAMAARYQAELLAKDSSASASRMIPAKVIRFALSEHGVVIPQSMFPQAMVESVDYLYQLEQMVPGKFFNRAISERILQSVTHHNEAGGIIETTEAYLLMKELGVKDFMDIKVEKSYSVYHDKPKENSMAGSW
jgi:hypothetical protein